MTFEEAIDYLYSRLPLFQNQGTRAYKPGLSGIIAFSDHLGNPHEKFKSIHVGGTNGKGSTSHMLASVLQAAGYKVGLYTSPHLKSFTERIRINGAEVVHAYVAEFVERNQTYIEDNKPSFFEVTVAMAFEYFASQAIDIAVVEVGMGGRLDSTNIIQPLVSVITNVGWDHTQHLGDSLPKIAVEKAGIIKRNTPVVLSENPVSEVSEVFVSKANELESELIFASNNYKIVERTLTEFGQRVVVENLNYSSRVEIDLDLAGIYQTDNVKGVLCALDILKKQNYSIDTPSILSGLSSVVTSTGLKGRWQKLQDHPLVICDTAHNLDGMRRTIEQFLSVSARQKHFVLGFVADKDVRSILALFPRSASYYFCQPSIQRALVVEELILIADELGLNGSSFKNVNEALSQAITNASSHDAIYVGGSTFVVADLVQI
ncbi:bifunctional folylpolyglutamate synthase/dihydrofolate synthase [Persicitalea jodogahamensis]|uniref:Dihydrofolate synthase/folylpolyglutamate synthase n=1 Tax=Persicitalea jodogahamensis TaxID=402147 RepID=A0A8J3D6R0_9BACT|nr:folylpolyglutamate synthase/dihydrofolate synthase family protein [Persicitalea jodogahamensis]GHB82212.1 folylpolyglutamate synthase [Persicitalea jodogahamensis]